MATLVKRTLHSSIAESVFRELGTRGSKFFFFLGKPTGWSLPPNPTDSFASELQTRNEIVLIQEIKPSDACLVVPRYDWESGQVYDKYDDSICSELAGINLKSGGNGYSSTPTVNIIGGGPNAGGATAVANIDEQGRVVDVTLTNKGKGYTQAPAITFTGAILQDGGAPAVAEGVINSLPSGATSPSGEIMLEYAKFYVLTEDFNVYKCLNNNYGAPSTVKPSTTSPDPIYTSDGYVWRFMYNIPVTLRNKFLTPEFMPVLNALNDNFYSKGEIGNVSIISGGKNYTWAKIVVDGDGCNEDNPVLLSNLSINHGGLNYASPELNIQPPFVEDSEWDKNIKVVEGEIISRNNRFYRVLVSGQLGENEPTHTKSSERIGTAVLEYIGETARAELQVANGAITSAKLIGKVYSIELEKGGSGYTSAPSVSIISKLGDTGTGATAYCKTLSGTVSGVYVVNAGNEYKEIPDVVIGEEWKPNTSYIAGNQIFYADNLYTVQQSGDCGSTPPIHTSSVINNLSYAGLASKAKAKMIYGYGYTSNPTFEVIDSTGSGANISMNTQRSSATITPIINNGSIVGVSIDDAGVGYTYANLTVYGDGYGAILRSDFFVGDVNTVQGNSQLIGVDGSIHHIELLSGGYDYSFDSLPGITIEGDGFGAVAIPVLNPSDGADKLLKIKINNPGKGYRWANVKISGGSGFGAKARAVISPYLGHGKDSVAELFASRIMFYTVLSGEELFGFNIENEYRQVGILKNPRNFADKSYLIGGIHTSCTIISGQFDSSKFSDDMEVKDLTTGNKYRIVSMTQNTMLLQNLQNAIPELGDTISNQGEGINLEKFTVESVVSPTVDKYSGDLLYIENRAPFKPTKRESIALRSILAF